MLWRSAIGVRLGVRRGRERPEVLDDGGVVALAFGEAPDFVGEALKAVK